MLRFVVRRGLQGVGTLTAVAILAFVLVQYVGDPVQMMLGEQGDAVARAQLRDRLGLDDPVPVQFGRFAWRTLHGDLGRSYRSGVPVSTLFAERLPATLELVSCAMALALGIGVPMGVWAALGRPRLVRHALEALSLVGVSMPTFLIGLLLMLVFSVELRWLPAFGRGDVRAAGGWTTGLLSPGGLRSLVLPSITLASFTLALLSRLVRTEMEEVLGTEFISAARARGIPERRIHFIHAFRHALGPILTVGGLQFGTLVAFSLVTESVFQWPGLGLLFVQAVASGDLPVITAYLMLVALLFTSINAGVDLLHAAIDPRLHHLPAGDTPGEGLAGTRA